MTDYPIIMTVRLRLPCCGALVERSAQATDAPVSEIRPLADRLSYWFQTGMEKHQCALVSKDNMMGSTDRAKYLASKAGRS